MIIEVTDAESIAAAAREVRAAVGPRGLGGLINNAGIGVFGPVETVSIDDLRRIYEVNVFGQVATIQAFPPLLRAGRGRVVNIGSIGDRLSLPFGAPLTSSKSALASITDSLRIELRPWGIHVVLIEPGLDPHRNGGQSRVRCQRVLDELSPRHRALYGPSFAAMMSRLLAKERDGSSPEVVAAVIVRALRAHRPRARYLVGKGHRPMALAARGHPTESSTCSASRCSTCPPPSVSSVPRGKRRTTATERTIESRSSERPATCPLDRRSAAIRVNVALADG